jgi:hypothetical protein
MVSFKEKVAMGAGQMKVPIYGGFHKWGQRWMAFFKGRSY